MANLTPKADGRAETEAKLTIAEQKLLTTLQLKLTNRVRDRRTISNTDKTIRLRYESNLRAVDLRVFLSIVCYDPLGLITELSGYAPDKIEIFSHKLKLLLPKPEDPKDRKLWVVENQFFAEYHCHSGDYGERLWFDKTRYQYPDVSILSNTIHDSPHPVDPGTGPCDPSTLQDDIQRESDPEASVAATCCSCGQTLTCPSCNGLNGHRDPPSDASVPSKKRRVDSDDAWLITNASTATLVPTDRSATATATCDNPQQLNTVQSTLEGSTSLIADTRELHDSNTAQPEGLESRGPEAAQEGAVIQDFSDFSPGSYRITLAQAIGVLALLEEKSGIWLEWPPPVGWVEASVNFWVTLSAARDLMKQAILFVHR